MKFEVRRTAEYVEILKNEADSLFEANEDLDLALIGGLPSQEFYSNRRKRITSDIDIASRDDKIVRRLKENEYKIFYNDSLKKYSARRCDPPIHIDIYPRSLGVYKWDEEFFERRVQPEGWSLLISSVEDLLALKMLAYLASGMGKRKHLIDIYSIIIGPYEIDLKFLKNRVKKLSRETHIPYPNLIESALKEDEKALQQFSPKERRFIVSEIKRIKQELRSR